MSDNFCRKSTKSKEYLTVKELRKMLKDVPNVEKLDKATLCKLVMQRRRSPIEIPTSDESNTEALIPNEIVAKIKTRPAKVFTKAVVPRKPVAAPRQKPVAAPRQKPVVVPAPPAKLKPASPAAKLKPASPAKLKPVSPAKLKPASPAAKLKPAPPAKLKPVSPPAINLGVFKWSNNSCYMDSFFVAIMHKPNPIADILLSGQIKYTGPNQKRLKRYSETIKEKLKMINDNIINGGTMLCTDLRKDFDKFQHHYIKQIEENAEKIDWLSSQQEPQDIFAQMLNRVFVFDDNTVMQIVVNGVENESRNLNFASVNIRMMENSDRVTNYIPTQVEEFYNDVSKKMTRNETHVISSTGLFINVQRAYQIYENNTVVEKKSTAKLKVPDTIRLKNGNTLELASMIVHLGDTIHDGHYVTYIKHDDSWYLFDDMVESYQRVADIESKVYKNVTGLVYL